MRISQFFSVKNVLIMICKSGCHRSVANAESWSNMLTLYGRLPYSVSLLPSSELDFRKDTCTRECSERSKQSAKFYQIHCCLYAELLETTTTKKPWSQTRRKQESEIDKYHNQACRAECETRYLQRIGGAAPKCSRELREVWAQEQHSVYV